MANFGPAVQTAQISSGDPRTTLDLYDATKPANDAQNELGEAYYYKAGVSASNPYGYWQKLRYVRFNAANNAAVVTGPAAVYWTDEARTTVSGNSSDGFTGTLADVAGILLTCNNATIGRSGLNNSTLNGNFVWICVGGLVPSCVVPNSTAVGDWLIGLAGNFSMNRIAAGNASTYPAVGFAQSNNNSNFADVLVTLEK